jgi:peptidase E
LAERVGGPPVILTPTHYDHKHTTQMVIKTSQTRKICFIPLAHSYSAVALYTTPILHSIHWVQFGPDHKPTTQTAIKKSQTEQICFIPLAHSYSAVTLLLHTTPI